MTGLKAFKEPYARIISEPVEDTDTSSFMAEMSLKSNFPVQVTDPQDTVTLHLRSMPSGYLTPPSDRIRQPEEDGEDCICTGSILPDLSKELDFLKNPCEKCYFSAPPPKICDLMNDKDLLDLLRLKLDPNHCTVKNWKNFASRWGMSYDELTLLEHRTQGSLCHSPTQEFLMRYNQKTVTELSELCRIYQRIDVLRLLQSWMKNDWPSRWQQTH
ncbi:ectodysplasin-A receptor-associated adapter protein isoform 1-T1 [Aplochiton taeniatus]